MAIPPADSISDLAFPNAAVGARSLGTTEVEREVIRFFDELRSPVLRYVISLGLSSHDGEEIIQEVFLALFNHLRRGKPRQNLHGWIFRVAHNLALGVRHANQKARERTVSDESVMINQKDTCDNPEQHTLSDQRRRRLLAIVDVLPERDRCCLRLRAEGLRYREIADVLNMSLGAVSESLARSIARLTRADEV